MPGAGPATNNSGAPHEEKRAWNDGRTDGAYPIDPAKRIARRCAPAEDDGACENGDA